MFTKGDTILFTGDSITDCGRNKTDENINENAAGWGYANILKAEFLHDYPHLDLTIHNRGIGGNRIVDLYGRAKEDCYNLRPNVVSILIGINDIWAEYKRGTGVEPDRFRKVYDLLLTETRERFPDVKFVLMETFCLGDGAEQCESAEKWHAELAERQAIVKELAQKHNAIFVPLQAVFDEACKKAPYTYWLYDGVHPTGAGHMLIAQAWKNVVFKHGSPE